MIFINSKYPADDFNNLKINISTACGVKINNDWHEENVISPFSRLYYVKSGSGKIVREDCEYKLSPGQVYLIPVGLRFSHYPDGDMEKLFFHFNIIQPDGYDLLRNFGEIGVLTKSNNDIEEMYRLFESVNTADKFMLKASVQNDIAEMIKKYGIKTPNTTDYSNIVNKAINIIVETPSIRLNTKKIATTLFVSESYLSKQFKKETGLTVGEYIDKMVFYSAQIKLIESQKSISEISEIYGFCDRFYFSRRFKQLFGETPAQYRKRLKKY